MKYSSQRRRNHKSFMYQLQTAGEPRPQCGFQPDTQSLNEILVLGFLFIDSRQMAPERRGAYAECGHSHLLVKCSV